MVDQKRALEDAQDTIYTFSTLFETAQEAVDHATHEGMSLALMR